MIGNREQMIDLPFNGTNVNSLHRDVLSQSNGCELLLSPSIHTGVGNIVCVCVCVSRVYITKTCVLSEGRQKK